MRIHFYFCMYLILVLVATNAFSTEPLVIFEYQSLDRVGSPSDYQFSSNGEYVYIVGNLGLWEYDATSGKKVREISSIPYDLLEISSDDNLFLLGGGSFSLHYKSYADLMERKTLTNLFHMEQGGIKPESLMISLDLSSNREWILTGSNEKKVVLWDFLHQNKVREHESIGYAAFIPYTDEYVTDLVLRDRVTSEFLFDFQTLGIPPKVSALEVSADGTTLLYGITNGTIFLVNVKERSLVQQYVGHTRSIYSLHLSTPQEWIISSSLDGSVRLWDRSSAATLFTLPWYGEWYASRAVLSPQGDKLLLTDKLWKQVELWNVEELIQQESNIKTFDSYH